MNTLLSEQRVSFLSLLEKLAKPIAEGEWRPATFATKEGLLNGQFAGFSQNERFLKAANLSTPIGEYRKCELRDTDVLFVRFELSSEEIDDILRLNRDWVSI